MPRKMSFEIFLTVFTLVWVVCLIFFQLFLRPYPGFTVTSNSGVVTKIIQPSSGASALREGDKILTIQQIDFQEAPSGWDFSPPLFSGYQPGDPIPMTVARNSETVDVQQVFLGPNFDEFLVRLSGQWPVSLFFWLAGVMTLLFIRPRTQVSVLMVAFFNLTAFWLSAGTVSSGHTAWAAMAMRVAIWLTIPVYWHFLWYFPTVLGRLPRPVEWGLYGLGGLLALLQAANLFPPALYVVGFVLALLGSLVLIVLHVIMQRAERRQMAGLLIAAVIVLVPALLSGVAFTLWPAASFGVIMVPGFSAIPGYFFLTLLRRQMQGRERLINRLLWIYLAAIAIEILVILLPVWITGRATLGTAGSLLFSTLVVLITLLIGFTPFLILPALSRAEVLLPVVGERPIVIRANRLAGDVAFFFLFFIGALVLFIAMTALVPAVWQGLAAATIGLVLAIVAIRAREPFLGWFQERVLGMPVHPDRLVSRFSGRILSSLESSGLRALLLDEVLPSLLVRQSLLLRWQPGGPAVPFLTLRLTAEQVPSTEVSASLAGAGTRLLSPAAAPAPLDWARLAIPLRIGEQVTGVWLFGARDPDDYYDSDDIEMLETLVAQTALGLAHIDQANALRSLYQADVNKRDTERLDFARELHDAVLNPLAVLRNSPFMLEAPTQLDGLLEETIQHVRGVVKGLRPEMLNHGLALGLQALVDDFEDALDGKGPAVRLEMAPSPARLEARVELNLFRIAQQACQNAIRHAAAREIRITGEITGEWATLKVEDDGKGFDFQGQTDLAGLLAHQHYGLAGMHERASVIGAEMSVTSTPGQGTCVQVNWRKKG